MSTNISDIMLRLEQYGVPKDEVAEIVTKLLIAGQRTVYAQRTEEVLGRSAAGAPSEVLAVFNSARSLS